MSRSSEAYQDQQEQQMQQDYDDCLCCEHQENLSGLNAGSYFDQHPLAKDKKHDIVSS